METNQHFKRRKMYWMLIVVNEFIKAIYLSLTFFMSSFFPPRKQIKAYWLWSNFLGNVYCSSSYLRGICINGIFIMVTNGSFWYIQYWTILLSRHVYFQKLHGLPAFLLINFNLEILKEVNLRNFNGDYKRTLLFCPRQDSVKDKNQVLY